MIRPLIALSALLAIAHMAVPQRRGAPIPETGGNVVNIAGRLEPLVDRHLIAHMDHVTLQMTLPVRREVVLTLDRPWEGPSSAYFTVFRDGERVRMYYRGYCPSDLANEQVTCYAESTDGIHFVRPDLGLYDFNGIKANNIVYRGVEAHNFAPFLDGNPSRRRDESYKAVAGVDGKLYAFASQDGFHWRKLTPEPVMTDGAFDSLNVAFWDSEARLYRCYSRAWSGGGYAGYRSIQSATSNDFIHWEPSVMNVYPEGTPPEHFYTNATAPHPGAPHVLLSFPKRFMPDRKRLAEAKSGGVSDAMFMTSRDGVHWDRTFRTAWLRPGLDARNWTHRSNMPAWGIVETGDEFSVYVSEHYDWPDNRLRRVTVSRNRFAGVHADGVGGSFVTHPLVVTGRDLHINYSTSAAGSVSVEVLNSEGEVLHGFSSAECGVLYGDEMDATVRWGERSLGDAAVSPLRVRFSMVDADLYALRVGADAAAK